MAKLLSAGPFATEGERKAAGQLQQLPEGWLVICNKTLPTSGGRSHEIDFIWGQVDRLRLAIILDEAHRLARDVTLPKIMKEGRKFGVAVIVASQGLGDFHQDILGNAGTKVIFRMNHPESRKFSGFIRARPGQDLPAHIERLSVGSAYVQTPEMPFGSVVQMY